MVLNTDITGWKLLQETDSGLLASHETEHIRFLALRTRLLGSRRFLAFHMLVPGPWTLQAAHDLCDQVECEIAGALTRTHVLTYLKPIEDPKAWDDQGFRCQES